MIIEIRNSESLEISTRCCRCFQQIGFALPEMNLPAVARTLLTAWLESTLPAGESTGLRVDGPMILCAPCMGEHGRTLFPDFSTCPECGTDSRYSPDDKCVFCDASLS